MHLYRSIVPQFEGQLLAPNSDQGSLRPDPEDGPSKVRYGTACCFKLVDVMQISAARFCLLAQQKLPMDKVDTYPRIDIHSTGAGDKMAVDGQVVP